jgi:hypothetical protein
METLAFCGGFCFYGEIVVRKWKKVNFIWGLTILRGGC